MIFLFVTPYIALHLSCEHYKWTEQLLITGRASH